MNVFAEASIMLCVGGGLLISFAIGIYMLNLQKELKNDRH